MFPVLWSFSGQSRKLSKKIQVQLLLQCLIPYSLRKYILKKNSLYHLFTQLLKKKWFIPISLYRWLTGWRKTISKYYYRKLKVLRFTELINRSPFWSHVCGFTKTPAMCSTHNVDYILNTHNVCASLLISWNSYNY